ncbi:MAG: tellurite resistance TerB family protein [Hoeflea sp.]|uniref:tellurite resistance TerB family protein n=1 Tax=Hoeflea sp. TaxID=1940281 RepID=UPI001DA0E556|nr:tellurite resistance TerB family protein [Hoeflea sp.]MBU4531221.1 tellurite resistance TerB family protein [Alphaproteobacteria bacterium]MBU4545717.1 tellurite resistance TerB family protein [Alphaproteobacteria bacterium]MBU4550686.1 tellurite resistance TerB family protein [Alphaproteobacteria bacterium]MBV1724498.1 tellurite resistance TerB family protein [Hoeflea sp.]MBV1760518.1 tellurite resistance TerB family protein [Hoeflea sp.]
MPSRITAHDALIYLMVTMSAVDKAMNDAELARIGRLVTFLPVFDGFDEERLIEVTRAAAELLTGPEGLDIVLEVVRDAVPHKFYDTAYALAVEIASADYNIQQEEIRLLQMLRDRLGLDKLTCAAIERSAMARFRNA